MRIRPMYMDFRGLSSEFWSCAVMEKVEHNINLGHSVVLQDTNQYLAKQIGTHGSYNQGKSWDWALLQHEHGTWFLRHRYTEVT
jgi:hypothetical protein